MCAWASVSAWTLTGCQVRAVMLLNIMACFLWKACHTKGHCTLSPNFSSEIFARWKINTTSRYVNHVYTLPSKFSSVIKKFGSGSFFCVFRIRGKHFERCFDSSEPPYKRRPKSRMVIVKFIHFVSQHKALYIDPCTPSSHKLVVFFLICGSSIAGKASNWATDVLK